MATQDLKLGRAWDDQFRDWTDELQLGRKLKAAKAGKASSSSKPSTWTGKALPLRQIGAYTGKGTRQDIRGRLQGIARRSTQVLVKITPGKNHTMRAVRKHLQYVGMDGEGLVFDQDGRSYDGTEEVGDLAWQWEHVGPRMPEQSDVRLMFNIVFSMPEGTDERAVFASVKATCESEFAGHQWAMGQHFDEPHVHCHVAVKAEGMNGVRLNPRHEDLQRWRERFAHELRERGVEAEATRRATRMHQQRINKPWAASRLEERGEPTSPAPAGASSDRVSKWKATQRRAVTSYDRIIGALDQSPDAADRVLARELAGSAVGAQVRRAVVMEGRSRGDLERT